MLTINDNPQELNLMQWPDLFGVEFFPHLNNLLLIENLPPAV